MTLWLIFCSICILMVCSSLIVEGFGKAMAAKVAVCSMLATLISTFVPSIFPWLDGREETPSAARQTPDWTLFDHPISNPIVVRAIREHVTIKSPRSLSELAAEHEEPGSKIDYIPTCGGGEKRIVNRLDIAELSEKSRKYPANEHSC